MQRFSRPAEPEIRQKLSPLQFQVTQQEGTEPPFRNEYWDNKHPGIYVDVVSGEPLFSSLDKYDSGTGWPSFTQPLEQENVVTHADHKLFMSRIEVRSKNGDSHLGHLFDDGPAPTGLRYCMNSASLRFIPAERLEQEGYGQYRSLFKDLEKDKDNSGKGEFTRREVNSMNAFTQEHCSSINAASKRLDEKEAGQMLNDLAGWALIHKDGEPRLEKSFKFDDFQQALDFTDKVGQLANEEDHHPALLTEWGKVTVDWWTHKIKGLHRNDFIMAAKTDEASNKGP